MGDMGKGFDDWFYLNYLTSLDDFSGFDMQDAFQAGQQSRQVEIDELQKRIDLAFDHTTNHGGYDDLTHIINILKGTT